MSEPKFVTFDSPVEKTVTTTISSVAVERVNVDVKNKRVYLVMSADGYGTFTREAVKTDEAYDASAIQNFWPVVEAWVKEMAASGTLF